MTLSADFIALCADPFGEALTVRIFVRLNDDDGQPGTLVELTETQEVLALNPLRRRREREFGVVQGQSWQVQLTNRNRSMLAYDLRDCWCCIRAGFADADLWETRAQGKIRKVTQSAGGTVTLEVQDSVIDILNYELQRDIRFQEGGWASLIQPLAKSNSSASWDSAVPLEIGEPAAANDETFIIEFTTPTAFKVINEDGDDSQTGTIGSDMTVETTGGDPVVTIPTEGWSSDSGAYATGDRFVFYTARSRTSSELTAVNMVAHLIDEVLALTAYDVMAGADYASARYNTSYWTTAGAAAVTAMALVQGSWIKGTPIATLIQDALKLVHGSIYPAATGQIGLWVLAPSTEIAAKLNGIPGSGQIDILDDMVIEDNLENAVRDVTFTYKTLDGEDGVCASVDADPLLLAARSITVNIGWECRGLSVQDACDKYLNRYRLGIKEYIIPTTVAGLAADIGMGLAFSEGELNLDTAVSDVTDIEEDLLANTVTLRAHTDPITTANYFYLDSSLLDGTEVLW